ncbi:hypothetical protein RchiOBHm_Chr2g0127991 [Rosa chinensis]|uniref:Uncharacterized protein n=1 Tax=Rosa chinensis TaxID=74649 RepID=A0A2P6RU99_ROSCH|nr:hypothetical protein RchiOBHm_Chr2g0127991 [Rosa chinensis]
MQKSVHIVYLLLFLCASFAIIPVSCSYSDLRNSVLSTSLALSASDINIRGCMFTAIEIFYVNFL